MQNDFSFLPKLSLGLDIWEIDVVSRSFALDGPGRLAAAELEPGIPELETSGSSNCAMSACDIRVLSLYILFSSLWSD
jgi:hypothetical protein